MTWVGVTTNIKYLVPSNFYKAFMALGHLRPTLGLWASCPDNEGKEAVSTGSWNDGHRGWGTEAHSPPVQDWAPHLVTLMFPPSPQPITQSCKGPPPPQTGAGAHSIVTRILGSGKPITTHVHSLVCFSFLFFGCADGTWDLASLTWD